VVVASTDPLRHQQRRDDATSSSHCLQTVVMVTASLCAAVLLTLAAVTTTLYALGRRRHRRMTSSMTSSPAAAAFPVPVAPACRCGGGGSWLVGCSGHLQAADKSVQHHHHHQHLRQQQQQHQQQPVNCADLDVRRPPDVAPSSLTDHQPLKPTSDHSESTLLLVARDAWTS